MNPAIQLKKRIEDQQLTIGVLITDHLWPQLVEICQRAGMHYVIIDQEHGPHTDQQVADACQIGRLADFPVLVRCVSTDYSVVRRAIDMGPCGLMFPCVDCAQQLDEVQKAVWLPPRGQRRPGGPGNQWMSDFQYETWRRDFEQHLIILPQIESKTGLDNVNEIVAHELVTALAVGPYDLSADLGCCWDPNSPAYQHAMNRLRSASYSAGKALWMIGDAPELASQGYTFICAGEPSQMLSNVMQATVQATSRRSEESDRSTN